MDHCPAIVGTLFPKLGISNCGQQPVGRKAQTQLGILALALLHDRDGIQTWVQRLFTTKT